ncbi:GIY-YIG nuclease family protein [Arthrospiribacter ruber]|uniref:GIY-YIG nuclease family protein n=1 Tax=Arthrospiribacter ruber TaxID=2487934 RepID=A0A951J373_9BACT|nr:GIY-YIG nuclease family protein [Arthrospiribacter ruber]MBW3469853.1 GIY-YIG nuclease family protein [Arthrospiribacter ruber]
MRGITISNYLVTGDPEGVIFAYMSNWTGQAIKIPRNLFPTTKDFNELKRPGIYFLLGQDEENPEDKLVYIGEANNLSERIIQHLRDNDKSFAETIICFSSKDENLTVSHTKYLEHKTISRLGNSNEYRLINRKEGSFINLPKMVQDEMDTYFDNMKILLPTLGYNLLHIETKVITNGLSNTESLKLEIGGFKAIAKLTSNGIEVLKGSDMNSKETPSLSGSYSNLRKVLKERNIVIEKNCKLQFIDDYEFPSSSAAAAIILGYSINGRTAWKNKFGKSLKDIEEEKISGA